MRLQKEATELINRQLESQTEELKSQNSRLLDYMDQLKIAQEETARLKVAMANNDASVLEKSRQMVLIKQANADAVEQLE